MVSFALRLSLIALIGISLALSALSTQAAGSGTAWRQEELNWYGISQRRINDTRADSGLALLEPDSYLWSLARERARDMVARRYLNQTTPEGLDAGAYMRQDSAAYAAWTELRATDASGQVATAAAWAAINSLLNDTAGRAAVLSEFDRFGVGMAEAEGRRVYVVLLARSAPPAPLQALAEQPAPRSIPEIIISAAKRHGIDPDFFLRVARCESSLNPRAVNPAGPYIGLFQFHRNTFRAFGGTDIYDPYDQAEVAARMFARGLAFRHWECAHIVSRR